MCGLRSEADHLGSRRSAIGSGTIGAGECDWISPVMMRQGASTTRHALRCFLTNSGEEGGPQRTLQRNPSLDGRLPHRSVSRRAAAQCWQRFSRMGKRSTTIMPPHSQHLPSRSWSPRARHSARKTAYSNDIEAVGIIVA